MQCQTVFELVDAEFQLSLLDDPNKEVLIDGTTLDPKTMSTAQNQNAWTFNWTWQTVALDAQASLNGVISIQFDSIGGVHAVFDNLKIDTRDFP